MHILAIIFGFMLVIYLVLLLGKIQMQLWEGKEPENTLNIFSIYLKVAGGRNSDSRVHEMDLPTLIQTMKASIAAKKEAKSGNAAKDSKTTAAAGSPEDTHADVQATQAPVTAIEQPAPELKPEESKVAASEPEVAAAETQATKPVAAEELKAVAAEPQEPKNPALVTSEQEPAAVETEVSAPASEATKPVVTAAPEVAAAEPEQNETAGQPKNKEAESEKTI